jgi:putative membrane protein
MRIFYRAIILACAILLMLFAVSNRETVSLALWPLPFLVDLPLYLLFFLSLLVGAVIGASAARISGRGTRRELRHHRRQSEALERELAATHSQLTLPRARGGEGRGPFGAMKGRRIGRES